MARPTGAQAPRIIIEAPAGGPVGLTVIFRWRIEGGPVTETYRYKVRLDKGSNACDNFIEEEFDAGTQTCLRAQLSSNRYLKDTSVDFAIQATDSQNRNFCVTGRRFVVDPQLPLAPFCMPLATVSAASFSGVELAAESIIAAFGQGLATATEAATSVPLPTTLAGTSVRVRDSAGMERAAPLFYVSPGQINCQIPPGAASGTANVSVVRAGTIITAGAAQIGAVAPGLFSANGNGQDAASGVALRIKPDGSRSYEPIIRFDSTQNKFVPVPIDLEPVNDQVFLILFGTGFRFRSALSAVSVKIGGADMEVPYAGEAPGFIGLDQSNARLSRSLIGRGEMDVALMVDGKTANTVRVAIK
ncbi:MAG: hypothetical protein ACREAM_05925 [Blastocatellia bacterium]